MLVLWRTNITTLTNNDNNLTIDLNDLSTNYYSININDQSNYLI